MILNVSLNQPHDDTVSPHVMNHGVHTGEIIGGFQIFHFCFLSCGEIPVFLGCPDVDPMHSPKIGYSLCSQ